MLILNEEDIKDIGIDWHKTIAVIREAVNCLAENDFAQPIKPYLRYRNLKNRIIAMPAFVGGAINMSGIKWIASFPDNINKGLPRAHSVVILNNAETGEPVGMINTPLLSIIRTASVSGLMISCFDSARHLERVNIGISGFGPIGQYHLRMCMALLGSRIDKISVYDIRKIDISAIDDDHKIEIADSWEDAYADADIFITCTVSDAPYIDKRPKPGSLHLNVSLRDYKTSVYEWFANAMIVDDWQEACRENTDIEKMHLEKGLTEEATKSIINVVVDNCLEEYKREWPVMFNPMGMAVFDIAIGSFYCKTKNMLQLAAQ
jgi:N-[(2S)-2-amino-2-carboxyethyl]-L-glutamate dehydrogenase